MGDLGSATGRYDVPAKTATELAGRLLDRDFDITVGRNIALDHGFGQTYEQLIGDLPRVPAIPVYLNCATPPLGRPGRAFALGRAVGEELSYLDQRVLFVGSGGLSHSPPSLLSTAAGMSDAERLAMNEAGREAAKDKINPPWDEAFLRRIADAPGSLEYLTAQDFEPAGVGANEVRTWIAAIAAGNLPMETVVYEPVREWITGMAIAASR
jgi:2,3-dihydroxyphenylpropionate 1,2-dioxygenase